jgi:hypothetical protein
LRKAGFGVDDECRIKMSEFESIFGEKAVQNDAEKIKQREAEFERKNPGYKNSPQYIKGETLEMAKTLAFNGYWFNKKLISVRTSKHDDYDNGIDELIFDKETKTALAAVDVGADAKDKVEEFFKKNMYKGGRIKYGFGFNDENIVEKRSYQDIPIFVIYASSEDLLEINSNIEKGEASFEGLKISNKILQELITQSEIAANSAIKPSLKEQYKKAGKIFERL